MELGLDLGVDSLFETKKKKREDTANNFRNLKNHSPLWFYDATVTCDLPDSFAVIKCKADHSYCVRNYEDALNYYIVCQGLLSSKNIVWRDIEEAKARCYIRLHRPQEALECALHLVCKALCDHQLDCGITAYMYAVVKTVGNFEQATAVLLLLQNVHMQLRNLCVCLSDSSTVVRLLFLNDSPQPPVGFPHRLTKVDSSCVELASNTNQSICCLKKVERTLKKLLILHPLSLYLWIDLGKLYANQSNSERRPIDVTLDCSSIESFGKVEETLGLCASGRTAVDDGDRKTQSVNCSGAENSVLTLPNTKFANHSLVTTDGVCQHGSHASITVSSVYHGKEDFLTRGSNRVGAENDCCPRHIQIKDSHFEQLKALMCLLVARRLLKRERNFTSSWQRQRNERLLVKVQSFLDGLNVPIKSIQILAAHVDQLLTQSDIDVESSKDADGDSTTDTLPCGLMDDGSNVVESFNKRWFSQLDVSLMAPYNSQLVAGTHPPESEETQTC